MRKTKNVRPRVYQTRLKSRPGKNQRHICVKDWPMLSAQPQVEKVGQER